MQTLFVPAPQAELAAIGGVPYLFLPEKQSLLAVHPDVAAVWPQLGNGVFRDPDSPILSALFLEELIAVGALVPLETADADCVVAHVQILQMTDFRIGLCYSEDDLFHELAPTYAHMAVPKEDLVTAEIPVTAWITVSRLQSASCVAVVGGDPRTGPHDALAPLLKLALTDVILDLTDNLLLHSAVVEAPVAGSRAAMLIIGDPGAGKSTLAMYMTRAGCRLCGDDLALLQWEGRIQAVPFPATLKAGSWSLLAASEVTVAEGDLTRNINQTRSYLRPDAQHVRYLPLADARGAVPESLPVRWVVFLDRVSEPVDCPVATPLDVPDALSRMIAASWSGTEDLEPAEFQALAACLDSADCIELRYSNLAPAVATLKTFAEEACGGDRHSEFATRAQGA